MIAVLGLVITSSLMGCRYEQWQGLRVGQSTALDVQEAFKTPVQAEDTVLTDGRFGSALDCRERGDPKIRIPTDAQPRLNLPTLTVFKVISKASLPVASISSCLIS